MSANWTISGSETILAALCGLVGLAGLVMILLARRGRRIDDHPVCRKCGYDLTGKPQASSRCAECGADLTARKAIRIGNRQPRRRLFWGGVCIMTVWVLGVATVTWIYLANVNLMAHTPVWMLRGEASSTVATRRVPAVAELTRRLAAGLLTDAQIQAVVADAILLQPDPNFPWAEWGPLLNKLYTADKIGDEQWKALVLQAVQVRLRTRPKIRAGDPMPVELIVEAQRLPERDIARVMPLPSRVVPLPLPVMEVEWIDATLAEFKPAAIPKGPIPSNNWLHIAAPRTFRFDGAQTATLPAGVHRLTSRVTIHVLNEKSQQRIASSSRDIGEDVTIVPADTDPKMLLFAGPGLGEKMQMGISGSVIRPRNGNLDFPLTLQLNFRSVPAGLAHQAYLRTADGMEFAFGPVNWRGGGGGISLRARAELGIDVPVDVILRPDLGLVLESTRRDPIWGEEICPPERFDHAFLGIRAWQGSFAGHGAWREEAMIWLGLAITIAGSSLALIARRGRRIDDHPVCRKCGYDLVGRPESSSRCSECGADLTRREAIQIGNQRRQVGMLRFGQLIVVLGLCTVGWAGYRWSQTFDFTPYKPLSWLFNEVDAGPGPVREKALAEIVRRVRTLSPSKGKWLVDRLLQTHGKTVGPYPQRLDSVLYYAIDHDWASEAQLDRFLKQMEPQLKRQWAPILQVKSNLRRGQEMALAISHAPQPTPTGIPLSMEYSIESVSIGGSPITAAPMPRETSPTTGGIYTPLVRFQPRWEAVSQLPDGAQGLSVVVRIVFRVNLRKTSGPLTVDLPVARQIELHPADAVVDRFETEPAQRQAISAALPTAEILSGERAVLRINPRYRSLPRTIAMDAWLARGEQRIRVGQIRAVASTRGWLDRYNDQTYVTIEQFPFPPGPVDVILTPSQDAADLFLGDETAWGEEMIFRDVLPQILPTTQPGKAGALQPASQPTSEGSSR